MSTHIIPGPAELFSAIDFNKSDSKSLMDKLYKYFHENLDEPPCSTCDKLILKLSKHIRDVHASQNQNTSESYPNESKRNLRSRKWVNYSEQAKDSILSRKLQKNLKNPCDVLPSDSAPATSTSPSVDISGMDIRNPQIKMGDMALDLDMDTDYPHYPEFGGSDEEETKIDINYLTGADVVTTTVPPENITVIASLTEKPTKLVVWPCTICKKKFSTARKLNVHLRKSHPGEKSYTCTHTNCGRKFLDKYQLKTHSKIHTEEKPFSCDVCGKRFLRNNTLTLHKNSHSKPIISDECGKGCTDKTQLENHKRLKHTGEKSFPCSICGKKCLTEYNFQRHLESHEKKSFSCDICGKIYPSGDNLRRHKLVHSKPIICDVCGKGFAFRGLLDIHTRAEHTGERPFTCTICGKGFPSKIGLFTHQKTVHTEEMKIMCEVCGKSYKTKVSLISHMVVHKGEKSFVCGVCGKAFFHKGTLQGHTLVHTDERPLACDICQKRFKDKIHLATHRRTHTGIKPFVCEICNKGFASKKNLVGHLGSHSGASPFVCQTCDQGFKTWRLLRRHREIHTMENS